MEALLKDQMRTIKKIATFMENVRKVGKAKTTRFFLESRLEGLQEVWKVFKITDDKLNQFPSTEHIHYFGNDVYSETENIYDDTKAQLCEWIHMINVAKSATNQPSDQSSVSTTASSRSTPGGDASIYTQLPCINLPKFSGNFLEWETFRDMFKSLIFQNPSLNSVQRLHYLKLCLSGNAQQLLDNLPITDDNLNEAWGVLTRKFENKRLLVWNHLRALFSLMTPVAKESSNELKRLVNGTLKTTRALKNLGEPVEQ